MAIWNPWHGCKKISPGCLNCYVYRRDAKFGKDSSQVQMTKNYELPMKKTRGGGYKLQPEDEPVYTCMTSDFFLNEADSWRPAIWKMMKERSDLHFVIITKRIHRFFDCIPVDWGGGYPNVSIMCTCENQQQADFRLPIFLKAPIAHKSIIHEPMLESIEIEAYLATGQIEQVVCGGESGSHARPCDYDWILHTREQCMKHDVNFYFKQTGANFVKDHKTYYIDRKDQMEQAKKAGINRMTRPIVRINTTEEAYQIKLELEE